MNTGTREDQVSLGVKNHRTIVTRFGGPEVLQLVEEALPEPATGQVRVRILAAGVSAYDAMQRRYPFPGGPRPPFTPGEDFVGEVEALGEGVTDLEPGQRVAGFTFADSGGYAEYVCRPANQLIPVPDGLDPAEAVCLVVNYLTAYLAMHPTAEVTRGERILVHGAAGGCGSALLELGKLAGLEMYGTASGYNHEIVRALGATPIDYRSEDFVSRIQELTAEGVDVVFDPIGGGRHLWRCNRALRKGGRLVWFGMAATKEKGRRVILTTLMMQALLALLPTGKQAPLMQDLGTYSIANPDWYRQTLTELLGFLAAAKLKPLVAARFPLSEAWRAHERLEAGGYAGKVVLVADKSITRPLSEPSRPE